LKDRGLEVGLVGVLEKMGGGSKLLVFPESGGWEKAVLLGVKGERQRRQ